jgi:hypothetical protein
VKERKPIINEYNGYQVGEEIIPKRGWQKEAHEQGRRFFEPLPAVPRLERTPELQEIEAPIRETTAAEVGLISKKAVESQVELHVAA